MTSDLVNENDGIEILVSRENILMDSMKITSCTIICMFISNITIYVH